MADEKREQNSQDEQDREPAGLGEHAQGHAGEVAHEQGWGTNEDERTKQPEGRPAFYGGKGFDYGAQDFGDTPAKRDNPEGTDDDTLLPPAERKAS